MKKQIETEPKLEVRTLDELRPFPTQHIQFPDCSPEEDKALAKDIADNGLRVPIEIVPKNKAGYPANTIIKGHRRRGALCSLDREEAEVMVRYDLAEADAATIELEFLEDNDHRRHLTKLDRARVALRRYELERNRSPGALRSFEEREARERVGEQIGMSGRNLQRYFNVLKAPLSVQNAFDADAISLVDAEKIAGLPADIRAKIDKRLLAGDDAKAVVTNYLGKPSKRPKSRGTAASRFIKDAEKAIEHWGAFDLEDYSGSLQPDERDILHRMNQICVTLLKSHKSLRERQRVTRAKIKESGIANNTESTDANGHRVRKTRRKRKAANT